MPDLYTLAQRVCLPGRVAKSAEGAKWSDDLGASGEVKRAIPGAQFNGWIWSHDPADGAALTDVWYQDGTWDGDAFTPTHKVKVFERVGCKGVTVSGRWDDDPTGAWTLSADKPADADLVGLPLTADFLAGRFTLAGGDVATNALWPMAWRVDSALVLLYAYELRFASSSGRRTGACEVVPVDPRDYKHETFMAGSYVSAVGDSPPAPRAPRQAAAAGVAGTARSTELTLAHPRAMVVVSFTGCEPRSDFEPGKFVEFTRFHPHVQVLCDLPLHQVGAALHVKRPAKSSVYAPPASADDESNRPELHSILFTDTNARRGAAWVTLGAAPNIPFWHNFFDHHEVFETTKPAGARYWMVRRWATERTIPAAIGTLSSLPGAAGGYDAEDVLKVARQGAYDNIHMAPLMRAPATLVARYPDIESKLDRIVQAPVCSCDCLHMHWRWSTEATSKHNCGWGPKGPHTVAGAPMVPLNQSVEMVFDSITEFRYLAYANKPAALDWQVFGHHGLALALRYASTTAFMMTMGATAAGSLHGEDALRTSWYAGAASYSYWSALYYHLRWRHPLLGDTPTERLVVYKQRELETQFR